MARNIEIKARAFDLEAVRSQARRLAGSEPEELVQRDTFYQTPRGRLKLREINGKHAELIYYERPDRSGPKTSSYTVSPVSDPRTMHELLARLFERTATVAKRRELVLVGPTRVHLDEVEGLGCFLELEVVLADDQSEADGQAIAVRLMDELGISSANLVAGAYVDLLAARER